MRTKRFKVDGSATYHVMSKISEHRYFLQDNEKSYMMSLMRRMEVFTGCTVKTYAFMDNHFHILLYVPERKKISDEEVIRRARTLYTKEKFKVFEQNWRKWEEQKRPDKIKLDLDKFRLRMYDLSEFMKTFKQRLTTYYNANNDRVGGGALWTDRFKSVLVEESEHAQLVVGAYIDLNPVRAGIVEDPKDYRWSGYGEAVARNGLARTELCDLFVHQEVTQDKVLSVYRRHLYIQGGRQCNELTGETVRLGFNREKVDKVLKEGGKLSLPELLHCRVKYFSYGTVIGSKVFISNMLSGHTDYFGEKRNKRGAKPMKCGDWGGLCAAREVRSQVVSPGGFG